MESDATQKKKTSPPPPYTPPKRALLTRPEQVLLDGQVADFLDRMRRNRRKVARSAWQVLPLLYEQDATKVRRCMSVVGTFSVEGQLLHENHAIRCRSPWCFYCPPYEHYHRRETQKRLMRNVSPEPDPERRGYALWHLVFEAPPEIHGWVAENPGDGIDAMVAALKRTLAEVWGYKGRNGVPADKVWAKAMGAIVNVHAVGDSEPWPRPSPHLDVLLPAVRVEHDAQGAASLVETRRTWPELFPITRARWTRLLRRELARVKLPVGLQAQIAARDLFIVHVGDGGNAVTGEAADHHIYYSSRPLVDLGYASIRADTLTYTFAKKDETITHRLPVRAFVASVYNLMNLLDGGHRVRALGILDGKKQAKLMEKLGRAHELHKPTRKMAAGYADVGDGYERVDPRDVYRLS